MALIRESENSTAEIEFTRAVRKVYEKYGNDLAAFFRDVKTQNENPQPGLWDENSGASAEDDKAR